MKSSPLGVVRTALTKHPRLITGGVLALTPHPRVRGQISVVKSVSGIDPTPRVCYAQPMTQTKRDYAASLGLAIAGARGKLSKAAHEAIAKAEANGMKFADTQYTINIAKAKEPKVEKVKSDKPKTNVKDLRQAHQTYDADAMWSGVDSKGVKVTANARQICIPCGYSLSGHDCKNPSTLTAVYASGRVCAETINLEVRS